MNQIFSAQPSEAPSSSVSAITALKQKKQKVIMQVAALDNMQELLAVEDLLRKMRAKK